MGTGYTKDGKPVRLGRKGTSSTGKVRNVRADQKNWRRKLQTSKLKFDDDQKNVYLAEIGEHGMKGRAARKAGVATATVGRHRENDPEFAEREAEALDDYRDRIVSHHRNLLLEGEITRKYSKDGELIEEKHTYPIRLIELELKRVDPSYREKQQIDLNAQGGGVLVAPADKTPEQWIAEQQAANEGKTKPGEDDDNEK